MFFGAVDGVGKTSAMLEAGLRARARGRDVVVGALEANNPRRLAAQVADLPVLAASDPDADSGVRRGFDLRLALQRRPDLLLLDSLAQVNPPGSLHDRRWQDVQELLQAGIDVYTTANVLDVESLADVVTRVVGFEPELQVPDALFEAAESIDVIDLPPVELIERVSVGGSGSEPQREGSRSKRLYRLGPLMALRQLALRYAATHVDRAMATYRRAHGVQDLWPVRERLLVGVGPAPSSEQVVRAAKRIADRLQVNWVAVFVETPEYARYPRSDRERVWETLRLARELGAETATISGSGPAALLEYARRENLTRLVVGKPSARRWRDRIRGSRVEDLLHHSGDLDVYVIAAEGAPTTPMRSPRPAASRFAGYSLTTLATAITTLVAIALRGDLALANLVMLYLVTVVGVAAVMGRGPAILASVLSVAAFDWFCVPPYGTFAVADAQYVVVFGVMLVVAVFISALTARLRLQAVLARRREERTNALFSITHDLLAVEEPAEIVAVAIHHFRRTFGLRVRVLAPDPFGELGDLSGARTPDPVDAAAADWALEHGHPAGRGTGTLDDSDALYLPVRVADGASLAVIECPASAADVFRDPERLELAETLAAQAASAMERARLAAESRRAQQLAELNSLKSRFVAVAAHELRTPLTSLGMSVELIAERLGSPADAAAGVDRLLAAALEDVARLRSLVDDLLDLSRLEDRQVSLTLRPERAADLADRAIRSARSAARDEVAAARSAVPSDMPPVRADAQHLERALRNLIENAMRHSGPGGRVVVDADELPDCVQFSVADNGPGLSIADQDRIFEPFVGGEHGGSAGLGLAIVRGIVEAHGGDIWVDSGPGPGAVFSFTIPRADRAPAAEPPAERAPRANEPVARHGGA